jgi:hypothetical protein
MRRNELPHPSKAGKSMESRRPGGGGAEPWEGPGSVEAEGGPQGELGKGECEEYRKKKRQREGDR